MAIETLQEGDRVEVRRRFDAQWAKGFEVSGVDVDGRLRIRRMSDGEVLPVPFDADDVRKERKRSSMWWM